MPKKKHFDCVEMKRALQEKLLKEFPELGEEEGDRRLEEMLEADTGPIGQVWRSKQVPPEIYKLVPPSRRTGK